jgi:hypothetical protein
MPTLARQEVITWRNCLDQNGEIKVKDVLLVAARQTSTFVHIMFAMQV